MSASKGSKPKTALGVGAVLAIALCCAGPLLIAGGALGVIGGFLSNPVIIAVGVILVAVALVPATRLARRGQQDESSSADRTPQRGHTSAEPRPGAEG